MKATLLYLLPAVLGCKRASLEQLSDPATAAPGGLRDPSLSPGGLRDPSLSPGGLRDPTTTSPGGLRVGSLRSQAGLPLRAKMR